jgi:hypothetical protein
LASVLACELQDAREIRIEKSMKSSRPEACVMHGDISGGNVALFRGV